MSTETALEHITEAIKLLTDELNDSDNWRYYVGKSKIRDVRRALDGLLDAKEALL